MNKIKEIYIVMNYLFNKLVLIVII